MQTKQIFFGVLQKDVDPSSIPSDEERARRRLARQIARTIEAIAPEERGVALAKMLAAAAKNLGLQHLPKGVLSTEDDAKLFGP